MSGNGDTGADPNRRFVITDAQSNTAAAGVANERFFTIKGAGSGEVLRSVSFTPGTR